MTSQSNQSQELDRADTSETPMTGEDRFAKVPVRLHELLDRGEISLEAFALYTAMSTQVVATYRGAKREVARRAATIGTTHEECAEVHRVD